MGLLELGPVPDDAGPFPRPPAGYNSHNAQEDLRRPAGKQVNKMKVQCMSAVEWVGLVRHTIPKIYVLCERPTKDMAWLVEVGAIPVFHGRGRGDWATLATLLKAR